MKGQEMEIGKNQAQTRIKVGARSEDQVRNHEQGWIRIAGDRQEQGPMW